LQAQLAAADKSQGSGQAAKQQTAGEEALGEKPESECFHLPRVYLYHSTFFHASTYI